MRVLDAAEQIRKFEEFIELNYLTELLENSRKGHPVLIIDYVLLSKFDTELAEILLEDPDNVISAAEVAIDHFDIEVKGFKVRFKNVPKGMKTLVRDIRSKHIGKFLYVEGVVRQKSPIRPQVTSARFECPACGNVLTVLQLDENFKEPSKCSCGRKGRFKLLSKELVDAQALVLEESSEDLEGGEQPKRMNIFLKNDLVSPLTDKRTNPGTKIVVNGVLKEVPIASKTGGKLTRFDLMIEANFADSLGEDFGEIDISEKEEEEILKLAAEPKLTQKLVNSVAPTIYGHERVKEALLLQLVGGVRKRRDDGVHSRGDIHMLLIGDPGSGKSQLLKRMLYVSPKARYVSGKGATGAGLTAAVVKDEFLNGWSLEAGALVLANRGLCLIDELDKMGKEDRSAMHEALEQQTITISKANIQATLNAETTVLAAANPKFGRFDPYGTIPEQIDLPNTLINRFDLIFPIKDMPDKEKDDRLASFILELHHKEKEEPEVPTKLLRKYIAYARQHIHPILTDGAIEEIKSYYLKMRGSGTEEGGVKSIPISARQLEALVRLSEATAKLRLSDKVTRRDAKKGVEMLHYCLTQIGVDPETGQIDIDRISTGITSSQRGKLINVREIITELEAKIGKTIPLDDVIKEAMDKGIDPAEVEESIEKLKRSGDIFEPRRGFIQRI